MRTSELEYYFLAELIGMPDRELAQKVELHVWYNSPYPQRKILAKYLEALEVSSDPAEFHRMCEQLIAESGLEFVQAEEDASWQCRTKSARPPGYEDTDPEYARDCEVQQPPHE